MNLVENVGTEPFLATKEAIKLAGGYAATAKYFDLSRSAIYQGADRGVPANRVLALCALVDGQVLPQNLRPDVFELD